KVGESGSVRVDELDVTSVHVVHLTRGIEDAQRAARGDAERGPREVVDAHAAAAERVAGFELRQEGREAVAEVAPIASVEAREELGQELVEAQGPFGGEGRRPRRGAHLRWGGALPGGGSRSAQLARERGAAAREV